ncbi:MAG: sigma factor G inhibitor Gin [Firmicutes bacterium]|nr:sigma factor G inhibitor Gin [Bacillota bacterium]
MTAVRTGSGECLVCGALRRHGVRIAGMQLCFACERRLVSLKVDDPEYDLFVKRMRTLWELIWEVTPHPERLPEN